MDAAVRGDPPHARHELLRGVVRRRTDGLELPLRTAIATPRRLVTCKSVRVPLALCEVDVDADGNDMPYARGVLCCGHRGKCGPERESEDVDAIDTQPRAQKVDHGAHIGHEPLHVYGRGVGTARLPRTALIPVRNRQVGFDA